MSTKQASAPAADATPPAILDRRVRKFAERIIADPAARVPALARELNLSVAWLQQLFLQHSGEEMGAFVIRRRMLRAAHLLRTTELRVKEVSARGGYSHAPSFIRIFSRVVGKSPTAYRLAGDDHVPATCRRFLRFRPPTPVLCPLCTLCGTDTSRSPCASTQRKS